MTRLRRLLPLAVACTLPLSSGAFPTGAWAQNASATAPRDMTSAPQSVSNLASGLLDAVVNIATSQNVKGTESGDNPPVVDIPKGSPFEDYFQDFFTDKDGKAPQQSRKVESLGSGFVIDAKEGLIVTNNHVIADADDIEVNFTDGSKLKAELLGTDPKTDIALLKVNPNKKKLTAVSFGDSENARIGDWVMAIGNPFGLGGTVTLGIISARNRDISAGPYDDFIQTDAAINRGNSGGPLFDMNGKVIGINTAIISPTGGSIGIGFAIPADMATGVIAQLKEFGEIHRGWLAIRIQPINEQIAETLELPNTDGAMVASKMEAEDVDNKALKEGDVILKFGDKPIKNAKDLPRIVAESPVGRDVKVTILRDGKQQVVNVKLGQLKEEENEPAIDDTSDGTEDTTSAESAPKPLLGMQITALDENLRKKFGIVESVKGVIITDIETNSIASDKRIHIGEVIISINQEVVSNREDVVKRIKTLRDTGRQNALIMVAKPNGDLRMVTLPLN